MLGLANIDIVEIQKSMQNSFSETRPFVGRDLTPLIRKNDHTVISDQPIYFMTDDDVTRGHYQKDPLGQPYPSVVQPNHIETVIMTLYRNNKREIWKFSRYFDNVQFWSQPGVKDITLQPIGDPTLGQWVESTKTQPVNDEYELYNLTDDPLETCNLAHPTLTTPITLGIQNWMMRLLVEQRKQKRLYPVQPTI